MARSKTQRSSSEETLQNDVAQQAAPSEPDKSRERASVKRRLTGDEPHKSDLKSTRKRARVSYVENVNRVWSDDDVLVLLQAMIDYRSANQKEPQADYTAFLGFVKDKLSVNHVSVKQLRDKIRKLRMKYLTRPEKENVGDDEVFQLSKKVWDGGNCDESVSGARKNKDKVDDEGKNEGSGEGFKGLYLFALEFDVSFPQPLKDLGVAKLMSLASETMRGLENECKDVFVKELKLYLNKLDLKAKLAKVVLDGMISSDP